MASKTWIADRSIELLRDKPSMGAIELQNELYKKYKMDIPYHRVFRGKEKALDIIYGKWDDSYNLLPSYKVSVIMSFISLIYLCCWRLYLTCFTYT